LVVVFSIFVVVVLLCVSFAFTYRCSQQHANSRRFHASRDYEFSLTVILTSGIWEQMRVNKTRQ
jgi:hypothetical protein